MKITSYYPVLMVKDVRKTAEFYAKNFRFYALFDCEWYMHLQSTVDESVNLALLQYDHDTVPEPARNLATGIILNFEVEDVDAFYAEAKTAGLPILSELKDEEFGQRHFITCDPNGVLIDVIKQIPPSEEFARMYMGDQ
jgi:uncharacterized glyoxalase superfamily protein PhnB